VKNKFFTRKFVPAQGAKAPVKFAGAGKAWGLKWTEQ